CGKFYHVACVKQLPLTRLLDNTSFICPLHTCHKCESQGEAVQAIRCTRCPRAYHATCFPSSGFERLCSTRGICQSHRRPDGRQSLSSVDESVVADSDGDTKHESKKKDKKKKKKKDKKKDKKQKKEKKSGGKSKDDSSDDETSEPPLPGETKVEPFEESVASSIPLAATAHSPDSPPHKLDLNIVIPNKDRDSDDSKTAESVRNKKKSKKKKRARASETTSTSGNDVEEADEAKWVQCDRCKKWRTVPEDVDLDKISQTAWYCTMNSWDSKYASCDVAEEVVEPKAKKTKVEPPPDDPAPPQVSASSPRSSSATVDIRKREAEKKDKLKLGKKPKDKLKTQAKSAAKQTGASPRDDEPTEEKWVQCENKSCGKWRVVPPHIDIASLPLKWYCSLNTWAPSLATCSAENPVEVESLWNKKAVKPTLPKSSAKTTGGKSSPRAQLTLPAIPTVLDVVSTSGDVDSPMSKGKKVADVAKKVISPEKTVLEWAMCDKCKKWRKLPAHVKSATLPEHWFCSMNHWNPAVASCSAPEESDQDPTPARVPMPLPRPAPRRGKLSYIELLYAGNGHMRKAYTEESSTLSFEFEGKLYHRDGQYRKSSMYATPTPPTPVDDDVQDENEPVPTEEPTAPPLSKAELDKIRHLLQSLIKENEGKSILDMVALLHSEKTGVNTNEYYSYAAVYQTVQAMVQDGDMEAYRDERMVTVTVPTQISTYAQAYYVAGENNTENRTWVERRTSPHLLYRRKIQYKLPLKVAKPWKQKGFTGWTTS
ncbi:hypothetical protein LEN26_009413, partial [Aphanomyces euteiches]